MISSLNSLGFAPLTFILIALYRCNSTMSIVYFRFSQKISRQRKKAETL
nr:MAG TPA: hypothetical protein [Caudoviricetes sp.]